MLIQIATNKSFQSDQIGTSQLQLTWRCFHFHVSWATQDVNAQDLILCKWWIYIDLLWVVCSLSDSLDEDRSLPRCHVMWHLSLASSLYTLIVSTSCKEDQINSINSIFHFVWDFQSLCSHLCFCLYWSLNECVLNSTLHTLKKNNKQKEAIEWFRFWNVCFSHHPRLSCAVSIWIISSGQNTSEAPQ